MSTSTRKPTYRRNIYPPPNRIDGTINAPPLQLQMADIPHDIDNNTNNGSSVVPSTQARTEKADKISNPNAAESKSTGDQIVPEETPTGACPIILHNFIDINDCRPAPPRRQPTSHGTCNRVPENQSPDRATATVTTASFIVID